MATNDTLAIALSTMLNAQETGKNTCVVKPVSKITLAVLHIMKERGYIGDYTILEDGKGGNIQVNLTGAINKCGVIKPRFSVTKQEFDKFEKRFLPAKDFGLMIITTPQGIMTQTEAREKGVGGKLLAYVY